MLPLLSSRPLLAVRCALASGAALMAPPLRARRSCRRRLRRRCCRHRVRWSLLMLVTRDPGDLALLALRVVAAAAAALYVPTTFASSPQRADPHAATHGVPTCPPQAHATAGASRVENLLEITRISLVETSSSDRNC